MLVSHQTRPDREGCWATSPTRAVPSRLDGAQLVHLQTQAPAAPLPGSALYFPMPPASAPALTVTGPTLQGALVRLGQGHPHQPGLWPRGQMTVCGHNSPVTWSRGSAPSVRGASENEGQPDSTGIGLGLAPLPSFLVLNCGPECHHG